MNVYTCSYPSHWLGANAVVVAEDEFEAVTLIVIKAISQGVRVKASQIKITPLDITTPGAHILFNGEY